MKKLNAKIDTIDNEPADSFMADIINSFSIKKEKIVGVVERFSVHIGATDTYGYALLLFDRMDIYFVRGNGNVSISLAQAGDVVELLVYRLGDSNIIESSDFSNKTLNARLTKNFS